MSKSDPEFRRAGAAVLAARLREPRRFLQVVAGPRQVGKTTLVEHVVATAKMPTHWANADEPTLRGEAWLEQQWEAARLLASRRNAGATVRQRGSSPKLQVHDNALMNALAGGTMAAAIDDAETWGRITESAIGAHLINASAAGECGLHYWRDGDKEVDFVLQIERRLVAIEVKSSRSRGKLHGMSAFSERFEPHRKLLVGAGGIPVEQFLLTPIAHWGRG